ncbi:MAG: LacI family DNA-binding transcriptional regulator [Parabacteroides sp.]|nr:LacI family DNA-binding transcriptional regulator [Parabacteroides sp.]
MAKKNGKILIKDVAKAAGVSSALVSMVLNGKAKQYRIGDEIAEHVRQTAKQMNYAPNLTAKNLRSGKTQLVGLIVTDISNPFYSAIARIVEDRANELNYTVLISSTDENLDNTERLVDVLLNKGVEGLILVPCDGSMELVQRLHASHFPTVLLDRHFPNIDLSWSCLNNYKATELATDHLLEQGYKNIALIAYDTEMHHILDRISGYEDTMKNAGLASYIHVGKVDILDPKPGIRESLEELINKKHADAVIFLTNMLTINGLYCLNEMNVKIPEDIAVIGFNRNDAFNLFHSPITYIRQPIEQIAKGAIDTLIKQIKKNNYKSKVFLEPELVIQKSSRRCEQDIYLA